MAGERGYFSFDKKGDVHWVPSEKGLWVIDPLFGLRLVSDPEIICGVDMGIQIMEELKKKVNEI